MLNVFLITAVFCYFHILFPWALKNVEMSIKIGCSLPTKENDSDRTAFLSTNSLAVKEVFMNFNS